MLKREITFKNYATGEEETEVFHFNLSEAELVEMEVNFDRGLVSWIERIIETKDNRKLIKTFKELILMAYGEKSPDGRHFDKDLEMQTRFSRHAAYPVLFMELATDAQAAATWLKGVLPEEMLGDIERAEAELKEKEKSQEAAKTMPTPPATK